LQQRGRQVAVMIGLAGRSHSVILAPHVDSVNFVA
jgi:hypothetical protein